MPRLKRITMMLLVLVSLSLGGCLSTALGLQSYIDTTDGYQFLYPNGWVEVKVSTGPDVVFRDLIEQTENLSVIISPVSEDKKLTDLGTPTEVGYKLSKNAIAPVDSGRKAELANAESREVGGRTYYLLEYAVTLGDQQQRHNLASVAINRGKLYTLNLSTTEKRWQTEQQTFARVVNSFSVN